MNRDARRHERFPARMPMILQHGTTTTLVESVDISASGLCVNSQIPISVFSIVRLTLPMHAQTPIHVTGMVVHNGGPLERGEPRALRIHLHFFSNYPADRWQWLVSTIRWRASLTTPEPQAPLPGLPRPD